MKLSIVLVVLGIIAALLAGCGGSGGGGGPALDANQQALVGEWTLVSGGRGDTGSPLLPGATGHLSVQADRGFQIEWTGWLDEYPEPGFQHFVDENHSGSFGPTNATLIYGDTGTGFFSWAHPIGEPANYAEVMWHDDTSSGFVAGDRDHMTTTFYADSDLNGVGWYLNWVRD